MISIVTVNYKTKNYLKKLIESVQTHISEPFEYIIVDNDSGDNLDEFESQYEFVKVVYNPNNAGFGSGINVGASHAKGAYIYFLNPDTHLLSDIISLQKNVFDQHDNVGLVGGCLSKSDGSVQAYQYGEEPSLRDIFTAKKKRQSHDNTRVQQVDWVSGGAMMVSKEAFDKVGGFDERFFMYFEDIDLCKRLREAGYRVYWTPEAKLFHAEGGAEAVYRKTKERYYASQRKFYAKYNGVIWRYILWPFHQVLLRKYN